METSSNGSSASIANWRARMDQLSRWESSELNRAPKSNRKPQRVKFRPEVAFLAACSASDLVEIDRLLRENVDINTTNMDGLTALHQACIDSNLELIEFLLNHGADMHARDSEGWTPLHATALGGHTEVAKFLLKRGADASIANNDGDLAVDVTESAEMKHLLRGSISDAEEVSARQAEEVAMQRDANTWLSNGCYRSDVRDPLSQAGPLHVAAAKGYAKVLSTLLRCPNVNIQDTDCDGWTPLHAAAHWGQADACKILAANGADFRARTNANQTVFDLADNDIKPALKEVQEKQKELMAESAKQSKQSVVATLKIDDARPSAARRSTDNSSATAPVKKSSVTRVSQLERHDLTSKSAEIEKHPEMLHRSPLASSESLSSDEDLQPPEFRVGSPLTPVQEDANAGAGDEQGLKRQQQQQQESSSTKLLSGGGSRDASPKPPELVVQAPTTPPLSDTATAKWATSTTPASSQSSGRVSEQQKVPQQAPSSPLRTRSAPLASSTSSTTQSTATTSTTSSSVRGSGFISGRPIQIVPRNSDSPPPASAAAASAAAAEKQRSDGNVKRILHRMESMQEGTVTGGGGAGGGGGVKLRSAINNGGVSASTDSKQQIRPQSSSSVIGPRSEGPRWSQEYKDRLLRSNGSRSPSLQETPSSATSAQSSAPPLSTLTAAAAASSSSDTGSELRSRRVSAIMEKNKLDESETERRRISRRNRATKRSTQGVSQEEVEEAKKLTRVREDSAAAAAAAAAVVSDSTSARDSADAVRPVADRGSGSGLRYESNATTTPTLSSSWSSLTHRRLAADSIEQQQQQQQLSTRNSSSSASNLLQSRLSATAPVTTTPSSSSSSTATTTPATAGSISLRQRRPASNGCNAQNDADADAGNDAVTQLQRRIDYKSLYEQEKAKTDRLCSENQRLMLENDRLKKGQAAAAASVPANSAANSPATTAGRVDRRLSEYEAQMRATNAEQELEKLRQENSKLKADNTSLIRVISRLSNQQHSSSA